MAKKEKVLTTNLKEKEALKKEKSLIDNIGNQLKTHSSTILMGTTISSGIASLGLCIRATTKAHNLINENKDEFTKESGKIDKKKVIKKCWKFYIPTVIMTSLFIGSAVLEHVNNEKFKKNMAKAFFATETMFHNYQEEVEKEIGEEKNKEIKENSLVEVLKSNEEDLEDFSDVEEPLLPNESGKVLIYDPLIDRKFMGTINEIDAAKNEVNSIALHEGYGDFVTLNEFYDLLGLPECTLGGNLGWDSEHLLNISYGSYLTENKIPCVMIEYKTLPKRLWE